MSGKCRRASIDVGEGNLITSRVGNDLEHAGQREIVDRGIALKRHVVVRIPLDDRLRHRRDDALGLLHVRRRGISRVDAVRREKRLVGLLALRNRVANRHVLVALDVNHRELLHESRAVLERHEVRRLVRHVDKQREGGRVAQILNLALGGLHRRLFRSARNRIEVRLGRALIHQHEPDDGVVSRRRSDAGVDPHVVVFRDVVVADVSVGTRGGLDHVLLAEPAVKPTVLVSARPVVLLDQKLCGICAVDPLGHLIDRDVGALARRCVHHDDAIDGRTSEQADRTLLHGADPPRVAILVNLERLLVKHVEGVLQLHVTVDVARKRL